MIDEEKRSKEENGPKRECIKHDFMNRNVFCDENVRVATTIL